ncbi:MAG: hypothetical protein WD316_00955 [Phycisphaeraceae bacterium]
MKPNPFEALSSRLQLEAEVVATFNKLYQQSETSAIELLERMAREAGVAREGRPTLHDRLLEYFMENHNRWRSFDQIAEDLEVPKNSVRQVIYKQKPEDFEKRPSPEGGRAVEWRLAGMETEQDEVEPIGVEKF